MKELQSKRWSCCVSNSSLNQQLKIHCKEAVDLSNGFVVSIYYSSCKCQRCWRQASKNGSDKQTLRVLATQILTRDDKAELRSEVTLVVQFFASYGNCRSILMRQQTEKRSYQEVDYQWQYNLCLRKLAVFDAKNDTLVQD